MPFDKIDRPKAGDVETRHNEIATEGRKIRGIVPFGVESRDMGNWREVIEPTALRNTKLDELIARVDHAGVPIGRFPKTLHVEEKRDGLHWSLTPPKSRADLLEAIERGDLRAGSWQMIVGKDRWEGDLRHVEQIAELRDVSIVSSPAYEAAAVEYRSRPITSAEDAPQEKKSDMSDEQKTEPVEDRSEKIEARVVSEPEPVLAVEDRAGAPVMRSLADEFRSRGFPGERASMEWGEYRSATFGGTIDNLSPLRRDGVPLGADQRYAFPVFQQIAVGSDVTSVNVLRQGSRTLAAGTAVIRDIDAVTAKPEVVTAGTVVVETLNQVAAVETDIPNIILEQPAFNTMVEQDLRLSLNEGLDELVLSSLATAGTATTATPLLQGIRSGIKVVQAAGYNPDTVILSPANSEALDTLVTGISGGTSDFVFQPGQVAPASIYGLNVRVATDAPAPIVVDSAAVGKLYVSPITLARFEQDAGSTNQSTVRLEGHAAFGLERLTAAVRIAAS